MRVDTSICITRIVHLVYRWLRLRSGSDTSGAETARARCVSASSITPPPQFSSDTSSGGGGAGGGGGGGGGGEGGEVPTTLVATSLSLLLYEQASRTAKFSLPLPPGSRVSWVPPPPTPTPASESRTGVTCLAPCLEVVPASASSIVAVPSVHISSFPDCLPLLSSM